MKEERRVLRYASDDCKADCRLGAFAALDSLRGSVKPRNLELRTPKAMRDAITGQGAHDGLGVFDLAVEHGVDQLVQRHQVNVDKLVIIGVGRINSSLVAK